MTINTKFTEYIMNGIRIADKKNNSLGDRSQYVGASDIGQCLKKSYLSKISEVNHNDKTLLAFARGHASEEKYAKSLQALEQKYQTQINAVSKTYDWLIAHPDFILDFGDKLVVVECKDTRNAPQKPYESWVLQIQLQIGILRENGFNVNRGIISVTDNSKDEIISWDIDFDQILFELALKRANELWNYMQTNIEPKPQYSLLCSYCPFVNKCKKTQYQNIDVPEDIALMIKEIKEFSEIEKKIKLNKEEVTKFLVSLNAENIRVNNFDVNLSWRQGRESFDMSKIPLELLEETKIKGKPYSVLTIKKVS